LGIMSMRYHDGTTVTLGDIVRVPVPDGTAEARVVMLGDTYEHLDIDKQFLSWVKAERVLEKSSIVIEWLGPNPFAHNDPRYAPVGNYMFSLLDEDVVLMPNNSLNPDGPDGPPS
jgi:hypothetical protein